MAIGIILGIILFILMVAAAIVGGLLFYREHPAGGTLSIVAAVILLIAFVLIPFSFHTVETGEVAVVKTLGEAKEIKNAGTHFGLWVTTKYEIYDSKVQNCDLLTAAYSSDSQVMDIQMTLQYQIMSDKVMDIAKQYGSLEILQSRIQSIAIEKAKSVLSSYKAMDIIAKRAEMSPAVENAICAAIGDEYYVNITAVVLTNIDFSDAFESAVEDKMIAEQKQLQAQYENQTKIAQAEADAKTQILKAEADAQAAILEAEATAEANRLLEESLTEKILRQMYLSKWNGELPDVVTGEDALSMLIPTEDYITP